MSLRVEKKSYVLPTTTTSTSVTPTVEVELAGADVMCQSINVRFGLYFNQVINKEVLKSSLSQVLDKFPLLASREIKQTSRFYCPLDGRGARVYEQHLVLTGVPTDTSTNPLLPYLPKLIRGKTYAASGDPITIITLTEVEYRNERPFQCLPAACQYDDPAKEEDSKDKEEEEASTLLHRPKFVIGVW